MKNILATSAPSQGNDRSTDINRRAVYFTLECGIGFSGLEKFCSILGTPCLNKSTYHKHVEKIVTLTSEEAEKELQQAGTRLHNILKSEDDSILDGTTLDVAVSFHGTWAKRGHTSLFGVVFAISVDSGEVLDYEVLSKFVLTLNQWRLMILKNMSKNWQHIKNQGNVNVTLKEVEVQWKLRVLSKCGTGQSRNTTFVTASWFQMVIAKLSKQCLRVSAMVRTLPLKKWIVSDTYKNEWAKGYQI